MGTSCAFKLRAGVMNQEATNVYCVPGLFITLKCTVTPAARRSFTLRTQLITSRASLSKHSTFHTKVSSAVFVGSVGSSRASGSVVGAFSCSRRLIAAATYQLCSLLLYDGISHQSGARAVREPLRSSCWHPPAEFTSCDGEY